MANQRWTLLIVPDGDEGVRQYRVTRGAARLFFGASLLLLLCMVTFSTGFFVRESHRARAARLQTENERLVHEVGQIRGEMQHLQVALTNLTHEDEKFRLIAGLDPLDADVRMAGIGGPGTETLQGDELYRMNPAVGQLTFETRSDVESLLRRARVLETSWTEATDSLQVRQALLRATPSIYPAHGYISSGFTHSRMHPILHKARPHEGLDIAAPRGTPVHAAANGVVTRAGRNGSFGNVVEIDHGYGYRTRYAHLSKVLVRRGQTVHRGDFVAEVGSTGLSTAPHLHYEVLVNGTPQNPVNYILDTDVIAD